MIAAQRAGPTRSARARLIALNTALSQADRIAQAPDPEAVAVDGRGIAELLAFGARYGALIRFYDLADLPQGDWSAFFGASPAARAAIHAALDLPELETALRQRIAAARAADTAGDAAARDDHVLRAHRVILRLVLILDGAEPAGSDDPEHHLTVLVAGSRRDRLATPFADLHRHRRHRDAGDGGWRRRDLDLLEELAAVLFAELAARAGTARTEVETALAGSDHAPQAALWHAFVQLFARARGTLNLFPRRLLDFYYRDLLRQDRRDAVPAETYLTFATVPGTASASIPRGTRFLAGTAADGSPILYEAERALAVVPAAVTALRVRRSSGDGVRSGTVDPAGAPGAFPLFGGDGDGGGPLTMTTASMGFIVSSPALMLTGGDRHVAITFASAAAAPTNALPAASAPDRLVAASAPATAPNATAPDDTGLWFSLVYSTAGGWVTVENVRCMPTERDERGAQILAFRFALPAAAPPLVATATKPAPGALVPDMPASAFPDLTEQPTVIVQLLDHRGGAPGSATEGAPVTASAYRILSEIRIATVTVAVTVDGLVPPHLASPAGTIDPSQTFAPFGLAPGGGAALSLAAPELFVKVPSRLTLTIDWADRPANSTGFAGWYADYRVDADGQAHAASLFDNTSFRVGFDLAGQARWTLDPAQSLYLFGTDGGTGGVGTGDVGTDAAPTAAAPVLARSVLPVPGIARAAEPPYFDPASCVLRLRLAAPDTGFGSVLYPRNLMAAAAANAAAVQAGAATPARTQLAAAQRVVGSAAAGGDGRQAGAAMRTATAALNAEALTALQAAIPASGAVIGLQALWREGLAEAAALAEGAVRRWWRRAPGGPAGDADVTRSLAAWAAAHTAVLTEAGDNPRLRHGQALLSAASDLAGAAERLAGQPIAVARPQATAALHQAAVTLAAQTPVPALPNPPWLPTATAAAVSYAAADRQHWTGRTAMALAANAADGGDAGLPVPTGSVPFRHLAPFGTVTRPLPAPAGDTGSDAATGDVDRDGAGAEPPSPGSAGPEPVSTASLHAGSASPGTATGDTPATETWLLQPLDGQAALQIDLSAPVDAITLLFVLEAGPNGWSSDDARLSWQKQVGDAWIPIGLITDTTNGLRNTGVVQLQVATDRDPHAAQSLRVVLCEGGTNCAYLRSVTANALVVRWLPPAGAEALGTTMPAGTITKPVGTLPGIAAITQPLPASGGVPPAIGRDFDLWMAERLRHKDRAIAADDHARLALAAIPSLWQVAIVPATDGATGRPAGGHMWLIAVAGPQTPDIADPAVPAADPVTLATIGELIAARASRFVQVTVTNPPWVRITVDAEVRFSDDDTPEGWIRLLQKELIGWLSPWPDGAPASRGDAYWTRGSIAEFVRRRPYVKGVVRLDVVHDAAGAIGGYAYFTSAAQHMLRSCPPAGEAVTVDAAAR